MQHSKIPISVNNLVRTYGKRVALQDVDLHVTPGTIVGLVGPNGSGKTTLLKILAGFLKADSGEVAVFGHHPFREQARVMEQARFAFAPPALFEQLSPREHLELLAFSSSALGPRQRRVEVDRVLEQVDLLKRADDRVRTFSFGMRQRVLLALALLPTPGLLVLDEPTDGLDPISVLQLRELLLALREQHGVAILLSSHLLSEIEELVDTMLVLREGRTLFQGDPSELTRSLECIRLRANDLQAAQRCLESAGLGVKQVQGELELPSASLDAQRAAQVLGDAGLRLLEFREHIPKLETALLKRLNEEQPA